MKPIIMPAYLHEIFGERQSAGAIAAILLFGGAVTAVLCAAFPSMLAETEFWRGLAAVVLIFDICAGCIANFTPSTNHYYAARRKHRLVFIAVHVHIIAIAALLGTDLLYSAAVWGYTIVGASVVNGLMGRRSQLFVAALLLAVGLSVIPMLPGIQLYMAVVLQLFVLKVLFAFAVDHYGREAAA